MTVIIPAAVFVTAFDVECMVAMHARDIFGHLLAAMSEDDPGPHFIFATLAAERIAWLRDAFDARLPS